MLSLSIVFMTMGSLFIPAIFSLPRPQAPNPQHGGQIGGGLCNLQSHCCGGCGPGSLGGKSVQLAFNCTSSDAPLGTICQCLEQNFLGLKVPTTEQCVILPESSTTTVTTTVAPSATAQITEFRHR